MIRPSLVAMLAVAAFAAHATTPHGDDLPTCPAGDHQPPECLIAIASPGFDAEGTFVSWMRNPLHPQAARIHDEGNPMLALAPGGSVSQVVQLPASLSAAGDVPYFVPSLFTRAKGGEGALQVSIQLLDAHGAYDGFSHAFAAGDAWSRPSGGFDAVRGNPTAMVISIARTDTNAAATVFVDDVQVIRQR